MNFTPVYGDEIRANFYSGNHCILEKEIEKYFYYYFNKVNPKIIGTKECISGKETDGIIRFYDDNNKLLGWGLQEVKRDVDLYSLDVHRAFLQCVMYLGNVFYDTNILGVDNFIGIFLDSAQYFCFIPKHIMIDVMKDFEPLWYKYNKLAPSKAYKNVLLDMWAMSTWNNIKKYCYNLNHDFRLDEFLKYIYTKYFNI
jgi:hypothetical protein